MNIIKKDNFQNYDNISYSASIKGKRDDNEDEHYIFMNLDGKQQEFNKINIYALFDGHGGRQVSALLKSKLAPLFRCKKIKIPLKPIVIEKIYSYVQQKILDTPFGNDEGSTALIVIHYIKNNKPCLQVLNLGDCRVVLERNSYAIPLSKDHKPNTFDEYSRIIKLGGNIHQDSHGTWRIKDLSVSRAFGDGCNKPFISYLPECFNYLLNYSQEKFFVMACDGLWDVMSNTDVVNYILLNCYDINTKKRTNVRTNIAKELANYAFKKGSSDNISIIVVFLN